MSAYTRNFLLTIAYDGTHYSGWQWQPNAPTVQGEIEKVLATLTQQPQRLRAAGRTDAGVHAKGQIANFVSTTTLDPLALQHGLNALLPEQIMIRQVALVPDTFDARRDNAGKHYRYTLFNARQVPPERVRYVHHLYRRLDVVQMARAAHLFVGKKDFASFRAADCDRETTVRTLYRCSVTHDDPLIYIDVEGNAFLKNMVRIIAGTIVAVGADKIDLNTVRALFDAPDRTQAGATLPAKGLCMIEVFRKDFDRCLQD